MARQPVQPQCLEELERLYRIALAVCKASHSVYAHSVGTIIAREVFLNITRNLSSIVVLAQNCLQHARQSLFSRRTRFGLSREEAYRDV